MDSVWGVLGFLQGMAPVVVAGNIHVAWGVAQTQRERRMWVQDEDTIVEYGRARHGFLVTFAERWVRVRRRPNSPHRASHGNSCIPRNGALRGMQGRHCDPCDHVDGRQRVQPVSALSTNKAQKVQHAQHAHPVDTEKLSGPWRNVQLLPLVQELVLKPTHGWMTGTTAGIQERVERRPYKENL